MPHESKTIQHLLEPEFDLYDATLNAEAARRGSELTLPELPVFTAEPLDKSARALLVELRRGRESREALLLDAVEQNSGSRNSAGVEAMLDLLAPRLLALGFRQQRQAVQQLSQGPHGPHALFELEGAGPRVLLVGHVDTVFEPEGGFAGARREGTRLRGPGCADMKGGLVVMISALEALAAQGLLAGRALSVVLNGDEEVSSRGSRPLLEQQARQAELGLVFEPGRADPPGALILARKGVGSFVLTVHGQAAHSGNRYVDGCSALDSLMRKLLAIGRLSDLRRGLTLNVGRVDSGPLAKRNRVPDWARAEIDLRVLCIEDGVAVVDEVRRIADTALGTNPWTGHACRSELSGGLVRPPMPCDPTRAHLYGQVAALAALLEQPCAALAVGGGSDANILAATGLCVLDGLGPVGGGLHTTDEWVDLDSLHQRTALTAVLLHRYFSACLTRLKDHQSR